MSLTPREAKRLAEELFDEVDDSPGADPGLKAPPPSPSAARPLPERIGSYRILRVIASGGMGTVYEAQQSHPNRTVALKVMKRGIASPKAIQRFEHEAEILGCLRHPAIAQIFEAGTHDDGGGTVPFFTLELIPNAKPITGYANDNKLSTGQCLELFAQVCDGVHHGHQKGIVHRDLKPANILLDETGQAKVIDFGVARATDSDITLATMDADARRLVGTLQYMSPEQCSGNAHEIDIRSDVYSLGVVLYELLCGRLPYDLSDTPIPHATRVIQQGDPPLPGTIAPSLRGNIEAILVKALDKDPKRRYQSASALAEDIRRHQRGDTVEARAPSRWTRALKWAARHPLATTAAACLGLVMLTAASLFVGVQWIALQPAHFDSPDGNVVRLQSRGGVTLATLGGDSAAVHFAVTAQRPKTFGGGKMALFSVAGTSGDHSTGGQLVVTPLADLERVIWHTDPGAPYIAAPAPIALPNDTYTVRSVCIADVFAGDDHPGDEIITIHQCEGRSPCALRIHDWNGNLLFEAWHFGTVEHLRYIEDMRLLVCTGDRHGIDWDKANEWIRSNESAESVVLAPGDYPRVAFGLQPLLGKRVGWINDDEDPEASALVRWYRCMRPLYTARELYMVVLDPLRRYPGCAHLSVALLHGKGMLSLLVDEKGALRNRDATDQFKALLSAGRVPPASTFDIGDLPPVTKTMRQIENAVTEAQDASRRLSPMSPPPRNLQRDG